MSLLRSGDPEFSPKGFSGDPGEIIIEPEQAEEYARRLFGVEDAFVALLLVLEGDASTQAFLKGTLTVTPETTETIREILFGDFEGKGPSSLPNWMNEFALLAAILSVHKVIDPRPNIARVNTGDILDAPRPINFLSVLGKVSAEREARSGFSIKHLASSSIQKNDEDEAHYLPYESAMAFFYAFYSILGGYAGSQDIFFTSKFLHKNMNNHEVARMLGIASRIYRVNFKLLAVLFVQYENMLEGRDAFEGLTHEEKAQLNLLGLSDPLQGKETKPENLLSALARGYAGVIDAGVECLPNLRGQGQGTAPKEPTAEEKQHMITRHTVLLFLNMLDVLRMKDDSRTSLTKELDDETSYRILVPYLNVVGELYSELGNTAAPDIFTMLMQNSYSRFIACIGVNDSFVETLNTMLTKLRNDYLTGRVQRRIQNMPQSIGGEAFAETVSDLVISGDLDRRVPSMEEIEPVYTNEELGSCVDMPLWVGESARAGVMQAYEPVIEGVKRGLISFYTTKALQVMEDPSITRGALSRSPRRKTQMYVPDKVTYLDPVSFTELDTNEKNVYVGHVLLAIADLLGINISEISGDEAALSRAMSDFQRVLRTGNLNSRVGIRFDGKSLGVLREVSDHIVSYLLEFINPRDLASLGRLDGGSLHGNGVKDATSVESPAKSEQLQENRRDDERNLWE